MEHLKEKCGIVGIYGRELSLARLAFFSLFALQHRGQEASGITTSDGNDLYTHKGVGLVSGVYTEDDIEKLIGHIGIGHNRYSTSGGGALDHAQPVLGIGGNFALAHNGNLPSVLKLQEFLKSKNVLKDDRSDSEYIADAVEFYLNEGMSLPDSVKKVFPLMTGAFAITMMTKDTMIAVRDSYGMRPLTLGQIDDGSYIVASETCAIKTVGAKVLRDVTPGEMLVFSDSGMESIILAPATP